MSEHLHTVTITGDEDNPKIEFTCHGDREAVCHWYPDCDCELYLLGSDKDDNGHQFVAHDLCWMKTWFDTDRLDPSTDSLTENELKPGMTGSIDVNFCDEYIEWEFVDA